MTIIKLPIDTKSLYLNIFNDNSHGHTPTVATPIKQGKALNEELAEIYSIDKNEISLAKYPKLVSEMLKNSKASNVITNAYVFDNIKVNNEKIKVDAFFCLFIKKEIDQNKAQYGRIKLHYPKTLLYEDESIRIDNKSVLNSISNHLNNYAFIVNAFEYNTEESSLNFDVLIIGEQNIPYSKVFLNSKGVGNKFTKLFNVYADNYDIEICKLKEIYGDDYGPSAYISTIEQMKDISKKYIQKSYSDGIEWISDKYPYALYDFRIKNDDSYEYGILKFTASKNIYFDLTNAQRDFINQFKERSSVYVLTDVFENPVLHRISAEQLYSLKMRINSIKFMEE